MPRWLVPCVVAIALIVLALPALSKGVKANRVSSSASCSVTILRDRECVIPVPDPLPDCGSAQNELCVRVITTEYTYAWEIVSAPPGWELVPPVDERCVLYNAGEPGEATFRVTLADEQGGQQTCDVTFACQLPTEYCTRSQGFYGNKGGKHNGVGTLALLRDLITPESPLIVGVLGTRSLTIPDGAEQCVVDRLPAGGPSRALPDFGDQTINEDCDADSLGMPIKNRRFRNNLLGQVITLALNVQLNLPADFTEVELCPAMTVQSEFGGGGDRGCEVPQIVLAALNDLGLDRTVGGLLELANRALAGAADLGGASHATIGEAVATINECFEGCRVFEGCERYDGPRLPTPPQSEPPAGDARTVPVVSGGLTYAPNPARESTSFRYTLPEASRVTLTVYNLRGEVVAVLRDGVAEAGSHEDRWQIAGDAPVASGVYFFAIEATGLESGKTVRQARKLIVVR
jgi:hypothetical protein